MEAGKEAHDCADDHDVVEVRDDEVGVVQVHVKPREARKSPSARYQEQAT